MQDFRRCDSEDCPAGENCRFENNIIGFEVSQGAKATLHNSVLAGNALYGLYSVDAGSQAMVDVCQISNNEIGIRADASGQVRVSNSNITNNTTRGLSASGGTILSRLSLLVLSNTVSDNGVDGAFTGFYSAK
ncbi:MAG: right-handed parallel beta-helix repeat-containing protein [Pyrinomonadaceae bacterium]